MENKKDNKGQDMDMGLIKDNPIFMVGFPEAIKDNRYISLFKKTEKLSIASHLLTEHIEKSEPIRNHIRASALKILKDIYSICELNSIKDRKDKLVSASFYIEGIISLFDTTFMSRMISESNYLIIKREFRSVQDYIQKLSGLEKKDLVFPDKLFDIEENILNNKNYLKEEAPVISKVSDKGQNDNVLYKPPVKNVLLKSNNIKDKAKVIVDRVVPAGGNKGNRREIILKLIKKDKDLSIKDIHNSFTDCSEKTIQRELTSMVKDGLILRLGDKRWSRYSLA
jgi:hypothetical protein